MGYRPRPRFRDESLNSREKELRLELKELKRQAESYEIILDAWAPVPGTPTRVVTEMMLEEVQRRIGEVKKGLEGLVSDWGDSATFQDVSEAVVSLDVPPPIVSNDTRHTVELLDDFPDEEPAPPRDGRWKRPDWVKTEKVY